MADDRTLYAKIKTLNDTVWERRLNRLLIEEWLNNFDGSALDKELEHTNALHLLSNFLYFGSQEMRAMLRAIYRDLYKYPLVASIRKSLGDSLDSKIISDSFEDIQSSTRFLGLGNPSESGCHLLYYFRQENCLPKDLFIHSYEIFKRSSEDKQTVRNPDVTHYVFLDDLCGSASQAPQYFGEIVSDLKSINGDIHVYFYVLFGTKHGLAQMKTAGFDRVESVFELDDSFKCFDTTSRYFTNTSSSNVTKQNCESVANVYGARLWPSHPLGYKNCQLILGFHHNTPDNSLPIFWHDEQKHYPWNPIFKRYPKVY